MSELTHVTLDPSVFTMLAVSSYVVYLTLAVGMIGLIRYWLSR